MELRLELFRLVDSVLFQLRVNSECQEKWHLSSPLGNPDHMTHAKVPNRLSWDLSMNERYTALSPSFLVQPMAGHPSSVQLSCFSMNVVIPSH